MPERLPGTTMTEAELYEAAAAYIEQYGEFVGNFMVGAIKAAMQSEDQHLSANLISISDCIDELAGERTVIHPNPPHDNRGFLH